MKFITLRIKPTRTYHGYDGENRPITEDLVGDTFVEKVIAIDRILSVTEDNLFVTVPHGRVQTWSYEGSLESVKDRLQSAGMLLA